MPEFVFPVAATAFAWWISTGIVLWVVRRPNWPRNRATLAATPILIAGFFGLSLSSGDTTVLGAYFASLSALLVWGWLEVSFLTGSITGPTKASCPPEIGGAHRFFWAVNAIVYHEIALLVGGLVVVLLTFGAANQFGLATYALLWTFRLSAKLNLFLGVRNLGTEFLPHSLAFLASFFRRRPMNSLFPVSITAATVVLVLLIQQVFPPEASVFHRTGFGILATLTALAVIEHWFLVLPIDIAPPLWRWALESSGSRGQRSNVPRFDVENSEPQSKGNSPVLPVIVRPLRKDRQPEFSSTCSTRSGP